MRETYFNLREKLIKAALLFSQNKPKGEALPNPDIFPSLGHFSEQQIQQLSSIIGHSISNACYFEQAFLHSSQGFKLPNGSPLSNERMEFFGDALLGFVVAEYIFYLHDDFTEGDLTKFRANLVNKKSLSYCAEKLKIGEFLIADKGIFVSLSGNQQTSVLSDLMESLIAAVYLDAGPQAAKNFIVNHIITPLLEVGDEIFVTNYKSKLQEQLQGKGFSLPHYTVLEEEGPSHNRTFTVAVFCDDNELGRGVGSSKKEASQAAAAVALAAITTKRAKTEEPNPAAEE